MKITSRLTRREASNTVGVGAVVLALIGAVLGAPSSRRQTLPQHSST
jgi:hypothetical protein